MHQFGWQYKTLAAECETRSGRNVGELMEKSFLTAGLSAS
jgi:hypothetical protein